MKDTDLAIELRQEADASEELDAEDSSVACMRRAADEINKLTAALEQVDIVCADNENAERKDLALKFIRNVVRIALGKRGIGAALNTFEPPLVFAEKQTGD